MHRSRNKNIHPKSKSPIKLVYYNTQGLDNGNTDLFNYLNNFDIILLVETFVEENDTHKYNKLLSKNHEWNWISAKREKIKGRGICGMLFGHRKPLKRKNFKTFPEQWIMTKELYLNDNWWKIVLVYNRNGLAEIKPKLEEVIEEKLQQKTLLVGD